MSREILRRTAHRPDPLPRGPWIMVQSWRRLLFAHWPVPVGELRELVPPPLEVEEHDGTGWVGLTPFVLSGLRFRLHPPLPGLSTFPELNFRTYVRHGDRPGVWFFSLDAASRLAVLGARATYRLPYHHADMEVGEEAGWIRYESRRRGEPAEFHGRYRPTGAAFNPVPGSLEHFLVERYALYAAHPRGALLRGDIHHPPWSLRPAEAEIERNTVPGAHGIVLPDRPPVLHFAARQDTLVWLPRVVR